MKVSLDTNVWIFGILGLDKDCERILLNLNRFEIIIPDQVREELERNLSELDMKHFYQITLRLGVSIDFQAVPRDFIRMFEEKGLKKGDAEIGAYCEWRRIDIIVSENRDFLKGLTPDHYFDVMTPGAFCRKHDL